ncbi:hypothetical protein E2562_022127 [Oryza meyeriana var. granulata]|uniref:Uncharacterized protein n=1 Tax=Oryza meyeriana var. granulata TaxID=110450 RepID=A0A6G1BP10_9ORYZ|nr:hypothetical protein E2562_022127 [Oryza meyeriana var. granulata]
MGLHWAEAQAAEEDGACSKPRASSAPETGRTEEATVARPKASPPRRKEAVPEHEERVPEPTDGMPHHGDAAPMCSPLRGEERRRRPRPVAQPL